MTFTKEQIKRTLSPWDLLETRMTSNRIDPVFVDFIKTSGCGLERFARLMTKLNRCCVLADWRRYKKTLHVIKASNIDKFLLVYTLKNQ